METRPGRIVGRAGEADGPARQDHREHGQDHHAERLAPEVGQRVDRNLTAAIGGEVAAAHGGPRVRRFVERRREEENEVEYGGFGGVEGGVEHSRPPRVVRPWHDIMPDSSHCGDSPSALGTEAPVLGSRGRHRVEPEKQPGPSRNGSGPVLVALACVVLLLCGTSFPVLSSPADSTAAVPLPAPPDTEAAAPKKSASQLQFFPPKMALGRLFVLPLVSYADERGFGVGGEFLFPFRLSGNNPESHPSELRARAQVTFKGQTQIDLASTLYWGDGKHVLRARVSHRDTAERFYGVGPDTPQSNEEVYRPHRFQAYVEGFHNVLPYFRAGV